MNNEDKIISKLLDIEERMATKDDVAEIKKTVDHHTQILDELSVILQRLDQERIFTQEWVKRIEADVNKIKLQLNIS